MHGHGNVRVLYIIGDVASWKPSWKGYAMEVYRGLINNLTLIKL